jgi:hypothetical protein
MLLYSLNSLVALLGFYLIYKQKIYGWIIIGLSLFIALLLGYWTWGFLMSWNQLHLLAGIVLSGWAFYQKQKEPSEGVHVVSRWNENDLILDEIETASIVLTRSIRKINSGDLPFLFKSLFGLSILLVLWGMGHNYFMSITPENYQVIFGIENLENILYRGLSLFGLWLLCYDYHEAWVIFILKIVYDLYLSVLLLIQVGSFPVEHFLSIGPSILSFIVFVRAYLSWRKMTEQPVVSSLGIEKNTSLVE